MSKSREELLQSLIEKMGSVFRGMHATHHAAQGFRIADVNVGGPQVRILFRLAHKPDGISVKELAEILCVTPGAVTQLIDALVEKDLVKREEDPNDRRLLKIKLTKSAKTNFEGFRQNYFAMVRSTFDPLTDAEIEKLIELLNKTRLPGAAKDIDK